MKDIDSTFFQCPACNNGSRLTLIEKEKLVCDSCCMDYPVFNGVPVLLQEVNKFSETFLKRQCIKPSYQQTFWKSLEKNVRENLGAVKRILIDPASNIRLAYFLYYCFQQLREFKTPTESESNEKFFEFYYPRCHFANVPGIAIQKIFEGYLFQKTEIKPPSLEIGCGAGETSVLNFYGKKIDLGLEYYGDELGENAYKVINTLVCGGMPFPFMDETFSTILAVHIVDHLTNIKEFMSEVSRLLKVGGRFVFSTRGPNYPFLKHFPLRPKDEAEAKAWELKIVQKKRPNGLPLFWNNNPQDAIGQNIFNREEWELLAIGDNLKITAYKEYIRGPNRPLFTLLWYFAKTNGLSATGIVWSYFIKKLIRKMFYLEKLFEHERGSEVFIEMEKNAEPSINSK